MSEETPAYLRDARPPALSPQAPPVLAVWRDGDLAWAGPVGGIAASKWWDHPRREDRAGRVCVVVVYLPPSGTERAASGGSGL